MEPLWLPPSSLHPHSFPLPSSFYPLRRRAGGSIGFPLQLKGYFSPSPGMKTMTIFLPSFHPTLFSGDRPGEEGNYYMWGEPGPGDACRGGRGPGSETGRGETRDLWKLRGMTQEKLPSPPPSPPPSSAILALSCPKVFPIMGFSLWEREPAPKAVGVPGEPTDPSKLTQARTQTHAPFLL